MSLRLALLRRVFPRRLKLRILDELAGVTAAGFGVRPPAWTSTSLTDRLADYANFTARHSSSLLDTGDREAVAAARKRLYQGAAELGRRTRRLLGVQTPEEAFDALELLYHQIGIEISGGPVGPVIVGRCFFARYYTEPVCGLILSLDQGVVTGLYGGASFSFSERLTAGRPCCRALLEPVGIPG
jgi:hypothetical protein